MRIAGSTTQKFHAVSRVVVLFLHAVAREYRMSTLVRTNQIVVSRETTYLSLGRIYHWRISCNNNIMVYTQSEQAELDDAAEGFYA